MATASASRYIDVVDPVIIASARKHRIHDDILHAYQYPVRILRLDDLVMLIGPDRAGQLLEIGVSRAEAIDFIVHAMPARAKFTR